MLLKRKLQDLLNMRTLFLLSSILILFFALDARSSETVFYEPLDDTWAPIAYWEDSPAGDTLSTTSIASFNLWLCDNYPEAEEFTGVDSSTIIINLFMDDSLVGDVFGLCIVTATEPACAGYQLQYSTGGASALPICTEFRICVTAADMRENLLRNDCITFWTTCPEDTMDNCPPVMTEHHPVDSGFCLPRDVGIWFNLEDPAAIGTPCTHCSGINEVTVELHNAGNIFNLYAGEGLIFDPGDSCHLFVLLDEAYYYLLGGETGIHVLASDFGGNELDTHFTFLVCGEVCPPELLNYFPSEPDTCFRRDTHISFTLRDPALPGTPCPICSGLNPDSLFVVLYNAGIAYSFNYMEGLTVDERDVCNWSITLDTAAYDLSEGLVNVGIFICDMDGNPLDTFFNFMVCPPESADLCPPEIIEWHPDDPETCFTESVPIWFTIVDPAEPGTECPFCTGINFDSLHVVLSNADVNYDLYPGEGLDIDPGDDCMAFIALNPSYYSLAPGPAYLTVTMQDNAGNPGLSVLPFLICIPETLDTWRPCFDRWFPRVECVMPGSTIGINVCDSCWDAERYSGVDPASIQMTMIVDSDTTDLTEFITLDPIPCYGFQITYTVPTDIGITGAVTFCAYASDNSGNPSSSCFTFIICDTTVIPACEPRHVRTEPPVGASSIPLDVNIRMTFGPVDSSSCEEVCWNTEAFYGILFISYDSEIDTVELTAADVSFNIPVPLFIEVEYDHPVDYPDGAQIRGSWTMFDCSINWADGAVFFQVGGLDTLDLYPPCIFGWFPPFGCIDTTDIIGVTVCDDCEGYETFTGINPESVRFFMIAGVETLDVTGSTILDPIYCAGYSLSYNIDVELPDSGEVTFCVYAEDHAGNPGSNCHTFPVCYEEPDTVDIWSPCFSDWFPPDETILLGDTIGVSICDICAGSDYATGVDPATISLTYYIGDDSTDIHDVTVETAFDPIYCMGYSLRYATSGIPLHTEITFCAKAMDYSDNEGRDCRTYIFNAPPMDTRRPFATNWSPYDGETGVGLFAPIIVDIFDIPGIGEIASGVDPSSIEMTFEYPSLPGPIDITAFLSISPIEDGFHVIFEHPSDPLLEHTEYTIMVFANDFAGLNLAESTQTIVFETESLATPPDSLGPVAEIVNPSGGSWSSCEDQSILVNIEDPNGIDLGTVQMQVDGIIYTISDPELSWTGYSHILSYTPHTDWSSGHTVEVSLLAVDDSIGNHLRDAPLEWSFRIDLDPPYFHDPSPEADVVLYERPLNISIYIEDELSGVDISSPKMRFNDGTWYTLDYPGLTYDSDEGLLLMEMTEPLYEPNPEGEVEVCVYAYDSPDYCEPNIEDYCWIFYVLDTLDIYPPCISGWFPEDGSEAVPPNTDIRVQICDVCEGSEVVTDIDTSSVTMVLLIHTGDEVDTLDVTDELTFHPIDCAGYEVVYEGSEPGFPLGAVINVFLYAEDYPGNSVEDEIEFTIEPRPGDSSAPWVVDVEPDEDSEGVNPHTDIFIAVCDFPESLYEAISGVDSSTLVISQRIGDGPLIDITDDVMMLRNRCFGYSITYHHFEPYPEGTEIEVCIEGSDHAGNHFEYCFTFTTGEFVPPDSTDRFSPYGESWVPEAGASGVDPASPISVRILDCYGDFISGVDEVTIRMTIDVETDALPPFEVTGELIIEPDVCEGYRATYIPDPVLPHSAEIFVGIEAADHAGNMLHTGAFTHFWTEPAEHDTTTVHYYLTGTVRDAITGNPIHGISVYAFPFLTEFELGYNDITDGAGEYLIEVPVGGYCLGALDMSLVYMPEFYDGYRDIFEADIITISAASPDTIFGLDFELDTMTTTYYRLSGKVEESEDFDPIPKTFVIAVSSEEDEDWSASTFTDEGGRFSIKAVDGSYYVMAFRPGFLPLFYENAYRWEGAVPVEISGSDVDSIDIRLPAITPTPAELVIGGDVFDGGEAMSMTLPPLRGTRIYLLDQRDTPVAYTVSGPGGSFELNNLHEGVFQIIADKVDYYPYYEYLYLDESIYDMEIILYRVVSSIPDLKNAISPKSIELSQNYPNPFNPVTYLAYSIPENSTVKLEVFDVLGCKVKTLVDTYQEKGDYLVVWAASDLSSGIYFCKLQVNEEIRVIRTSLIK
ncbi:T9SS type A sorting domain-containing protein [bacterium]|nr:T9SS type A sorting domain-containing protein [bacterium]